MWGGGTCQRILQDKRSLRVLQVIHTSHISMQVIRELRKSTFHGLPGANIQNTRVDTITSNIKAQSGKESIEEKESNRRRELSEITRKHLERVINTMIPLSVCSSIDKVDSAPVNSLASQSSERDIEGGEPKQIPEEKEKQVIVNNCYITYREEGWKQLEKSEIPPNILGNRREVLARSRQENHFWAIPVSSLE